MGLLQDLPDQEQITSVLSGLIGDASSGTGISGVLALLENISPEVMRANLTGSLNAVSFDGSGNAERLTGGLLSEFQTLVQNFPQDPAALIAPLSGRLDSLARLVRSDLAGGLQDSIGALQGLQNLLPQEGASLLTGAAQGLEAVKAEFLTGRLGQLRAWSTDLARLDQEVAGLAAAGAGGLADTLIGYLEAEVNEVARVVLPAKASPADRLATRLSSALTTDRLAALEQRKQALIQAMNAARQELANGNTTNTAQLDAAGTAFQALHKEVTGMAAGLAGALDDAESGPEGMAAALRRQYEQFQAVEIVDLGSVSQRLAEALENLRATLAGFDLDEARAELDRVFQGMRESDNHFDVSRVSAQLSGVREQIETAANDLDSLLLEIVASIRAAFSQIREGLRSVVTGLGEYDAEGHFHFHIQREIEEFLNGIRRTVNDTLTPLLNGFKDVVRGVLDQVKGLLDAVDAQIDSVKAQLQGGLQGASDRLRELDVPDKVEDIGGRLEAMLSQLGEINFDLVTNPVVAEIEAMRDQLRGIDTSALNDFLREALGVAVKVVISIDFPGQITNVLMEEIDRLLQIPKDALNAIENRVEDALRQVGRLAPDELLRPLDTLFEPLTLALNQLDVDALVEPVAEWYGTVLTEVDRLSPAVLLQPVADAYNSLQETLRLISPERLTQPIEATLAGFRAELQRLDFSGITGEIGAAIQSVRHLLAGLTPDTLLAPLVQIFDTVETALDDVDPESLLAPLKRLFDRLASPLHNLTPAAAQRIGETFAPLAALPEKFDPRGVFAAAAEHWTATQNAAQGLNVGHLIADLRAPYESLNAALPGGADERLAAKVAALNPLRSEELGAAANRLQQLQPRLDTMFAQAEPPAELVSQYEQLRPRLESLIPAWARGPVTPEAVRAALAEYDLSNVAEEARAIVEEIKTQLSALDPRTLQDDLRQTFTALDNALASLSPEALAGEVNGIIHALTEKLDLLNPQLIVEELNSLSDEVQEVLAGIDPSGIIAALEGLAKDVRTVTTALDPAALLGELKEPFDQVRAILDSFSPRAFREALQILFGEIQAILEAIDLGEVLEPIVARLDALRDELRRSLNRTEAAFEEMIAAIPL
jgi:hypothetical protein